MKKLFGAVLAGTVALTLAGCGEDPDTRTAITYAGWSASSEGYQALIEEFNATNEEYRIEVVSYSGDYNEFLQTKAAAGDLPDVFETSNVVGHAQLGYSKNLAEYLVEDEDWANVPADIKNAITSTSEGKDYIYALPTKLYYQGYFANQTLIEDYTDATFAAKMEAGTGWNLADFEKAIQEVNDVNSTQTSVIGLNNSNSALRWLPNALGATYDYEFYTYAETAAAQFDFMGPKVFESFTKLASWNDSKYTMDSFDGNNADGVWGEGSERFDAFGTNDAMQAFKNGQVGLAWEATWSYAAMAGGDNPVDETQTWDFIGLPDNQVIGIIDYMAISDNCENVEGALEVAKFFGISEVGIQARIDIMDKTDITYAEVPVTTNEVLLDAYFASLPTDGIEKIATGDYTLLVEPAKTSPGFHAGRNNFVLYQAGDETNIPAHRDPANKYTIGDLIWDAAGGKVNYGDHMTNEVQTIIWASAQADIDAYWDSLKA